MIMFSVFLKKSPRTGLTEFWAYFENRQTGSCSICFGSMFKGGKQILSKESGYSVSMRQRKINDGYKFICETSMPNIENAISAVRGHSSALLSEDAYSIYSQALSIVNRTPNRSLRKAHSGLDSTKIMEPPKATSMNLDSRQKLPSIAVVTDVNCGWAW